MSQIVDPTGGMVLPELLAVKAPLPKPDFSSFWQDTYLETLAQDLDVAQRQVASSVAGFSCFEIEYNSFGGFRVGGWLTVPQDDSFDRIAVVSHGYGGRTTPDYRIPGSPAAILWPCARGFDRSARPDLPGQSMRHVLHGIESRQTYIHRGCVADLWSAASVLLQLFPQCATNLHYLGGSFGGGMGALMLPWDERFKRAYLDVPSFGNHPLRLQLPCTGSGESVRRYARRHPEVKGVLEYFDSAVAAQFIAIPTFVSAAVSDPSVPPPGQFSVYNALSGEKELFVRSAGHPNDVEDDRRISELLSVWF